VFLVNLARLLDRARELEIPVMVFTFYRSPEDQEKEFLAGRSRVRSGRHQQWLAVDLVVWNDLNSDQEVDKNELRWKFVSEYRRLGEVWESLGGVWGGRWSDPCDPYHFEWSDRLKLIGV
jgi:hypothetical protein